MSLREFLSANEIAQAEIVRATGKDAANVNRLVNDPDANPTRETIETLLAFLSKRLGRPVTYEEAFNGKAA